MSSFLSGRWLLGYGDRLPDDLPGSWDYEAGREQASRQVASPFVYSETAEVRSASTRGVSRSASESPGL